MNKNIEGDLILLKYYRPFALSCADEEENAAAAEEEERACACLTFYRQSHGGSRGSLLNYSMCVCRTIAWINSI